VAVLVVGCTIFIAFLKNKDKIREKEQRDRDRDEEREGEEEEEVEEEDGGHKKKPMLDIYKMEVDEDKLKVLMGFVQENGGGDFNPTQNEVLQRFSVIKAKTACYFSQKAKIWGTPTWEPSLSVEENMEKCIPVLARFVETIKLKKFLDAIVIEAPGAQYGQSIAAVSNLLHRVCNVLSEKDPCGSRFMDISPADFTAWSLTFGDEAFFVTTFAPCYSSSHPRYAYGATSTFILMQPEISFLVHKIPIDGKPGTPRFIIREAFKELGQPYEHHEPREIPVASWFVRPLEIKANGQHKKPKDGFEIVPWWDM